MPEVPLGYSSHKRRTTWNPQILVVNMLAEKTDTNRFNGVDHIQRPGLPVFAELGPDPIQGVFRQAGTFGGDFLSAEGGTLYRVTSESVSTTLGALGGSERFNAAATATRAIVVANGVATSTNGTTVSNVVMPDGRLVSSVAEMNGYFLLADATAGSARIYFIEPGQTNPDGLGFFASESVPGNIVKIERVGDEIWVFKREGLEVHVPTGDPDLPFQRVSGRNYDKGARAKDTITRFDNTVAWVGNDGLVYRGDATPVRMSTHAVEEQIRKSNVEDLTAWSFDMDGHRLYCLTVTGGTWVYDVATQQWSQFKSYELPYWRAYVGDSGDTFTVAGDRQTGTLYRVDPEASNDAGQPIERILTGGVPVAGNAERCDTFTLYATSGTAQDPNLYPKARISWSDDLETFGDWEDVSIGRQGRYGEPIRMNRLGMMRYPGRLWKIEVTDDVVWTVHAASYNEPLR